jgi:ribonucleoside-diphosphate reductase alpha chain
MSIGNCAHDELRDEPALSENARKVLEARYLKKNETGECIETPRDLFRRVARTIANIETQYGGSELDRTRWEDRFYDLMTSGAFMPNSPTLMNAGREMGMLSACFVLPVRDSIVDIFNCIKHTALIQKAGGGTGFAFDELRPTGDFIASSGGTTSGPISFWRAFSEATNAIQQGAFRRGANMGMMYIHHPDILKFLHAKQDLNQFTNYNISVKVTNVWMDEFRAAPDSPHVLRNPRTGKAYVVARDCDIWKYNIRDLIEITCVAPVSPTSRASYYETPRLTGALPAELQRRVYTKRDIWNIIVNNAWQTGEPGVVFMDRINEFNPTPHLGRIEATNPCGEQPLLPYEACNLGSLNLGLYVKNPCTPRATVDWDGLRAAIQVATRFLDNVIDANNYPLAEITRICQDNRKIGLGVMGFADALFKLGVPYDSEEGVAWGERFMKFLNDEGHNYSEQLARERGCFPNWKGSIWHTQHNRMMRNAAVTTVAPTGTISIIANCSGGIEPMFSLAFIRNVLKGHQHGERPLVEVNETFQSVAEARGFYSAALIERIAHEGTLEYFAEVPADVKRVFVCAHDITPEWHMRMQAAFQRHCDASISKTINFPEHATRDEVEQIYMLAYEMGCKGVTVYRDGCRLQQPMALKKEEGTELRPTEEGGRRRHTGTQDHADDCDCDEGCEASAAPVTIEPMDLPEIVSGLRIRQMTPFGNMHVKITVNPRHDRELEVFAQLGKGGDVANSDLEAICRMISLWLRAGGSLRHVVKQLEGIGSSLQIPTRAGRIMSLGDGLACALKKYTRAKERFGLRSLLLGEIDLAELDNPNPPPHRPETTPLDRPVVLDHSGPGGNGGQSGNGGHGRPPARAAAPVLHRAALRTPDSTRVEPPKAVYAEAEVGHGNGNWNGNGNGGAYAYTYTVSSTALAAIEAADNARTAVELGEEPAVATLIAEPLSAAEQRLTQTLDVSALVPQHSRDVASHYKLKCPECNSALMLQEGCRKCSNPGCGWAAC